MKSIIITNDHYNGLGVIRSLGENGIYNIVILLKKDSSFIENSKYINKLIKIGNNEEEIIQQINNVVRDSDSYFIFPLSDGVASIIDKHYQDFPSNVIVPNMLGEMERFLNKNAVKEIAVENNLNVPKSIIITDEQPENLKWDIFPAILKPVKSIEGKKSDIVKINKREDLRKELELMREKGYRRILLEEFVYGASEHMIEVMGYCTKSREPVICGIIQKIREYPFYNGSTSYAKIVDKHEGLDLNNLNAFLRSFKYYGIFDVEFKYADGKVYFIECNFRNGAPSYALTYNGKNVPLLWTQNQSTKIKSKLKKEYFMCEQYDSLNMIKGHVNVMSWMKDFVFAKKIFFNSSDLKPVLKYYFLLIKKKGQLLNLWS